MGYRLHYATVYKVEYNNNGFGSRHSEAINIILCDLSGGNLFYNSEFADTADELEIKRDVLENIIKQLYAVKHFSELHLDNYPCVRELDETDYTPNDVAGFFQDALDRSDQSNDYVKFSWF